MLLTCTMNNFEKQWVIVVDDDEDDRFIIQQAFKQQSHEYLLQALASGQELFWVLDQSITLPALLLLDLNMPLMDGFEVLARLRTHSSYSSIPIVILTTSEADVDRQRAQNLGANNFMTKPPTLDELTKVVNQLREDWLVSK